MYYNYTNTILESGEKHNEQHACSKYQSNIQNDCRKNTLKMMGTQTKAQIIQSAL